jgi:hypothetical protein
MQQCIVCYESTDTPACPYCNEPTCGQCLVTYALHQTNSPAVCTNANCRKPLELPFLVRAFTPEQYKQYKQHFGKILLEEDRQQYGPITEPVVQASQLLEQSLQARCKITTHEMKINRHQRALGKQWTDLHAETQKELQQIQLDDKNALLTGLGFRPLENLSMNMGMFLHPMSVPVRGIDDQLLNERVYKSIAKTGAINPHLHYQLGRRLVLADEYDTAEERLPKDVVETLYGYVHYR